MNIHEFGNPGSPAVVLIHPSLVMWDYFEYVIPHLSPSYHVVVPALPGYDPELPADFTSIEDIAAELETWLLARGIDTVGCIYGCSMGGSIVTRFLANGRVHAESAVIDGGITPYQLPWLVTRLISVKDFATVWLGKLGGLKLLEKAFDTDEYSDEDLQYIADVLRMTSAKTIWRTFDSCNNYSMPSPVRIGCPKVEYWYTSAEARSRKADIAYVRKHVPQTVFKEFTDVGHGGMAVLQPERFASELVRLMQQ